MLWRFPRERRASATAPVSQADIAAIVVIATTGMFVALSFLEQWGVPLWLRVVFVYLFGLFPFRFIYGLFPHPDATTVRKHAVGTFVTLTFASAMLINPHVADIAPWKRGAVAALAAVPLAYVWLYLLDRIGVAGVAYKRGRWRGRRS